MLAVLASRLRELDQYAGRDTVLRHMYFGTIVYWYLRPLPPQRYYALRAAPRNAAPARVPMSANARENRYRWAARTE